MNLMSDLSSCWIPQKRSGGRQYRRLLVRSGESSRGHGDHGLDVTRCVWGESERPHVGRSMVAIYHPDVSGEALSCVLILGCAYLACTFVARLQYLELFAISRALPLLSCTEPKPELVLFLQHASLLHVGLGSWALLSFGPAVESAYGTLGFSMIYFLGGLLGNLTSFFHTTEWTVGGTVSHPITKS